MSFSKEWNTRYQQNTHLSVWPWTDLVSFVMRYSKPEGKKFKVLELGCGAGANIPFFLSFEETEYFGIDGSSVIISKLKKRFPKIKNNFVVGDFTTKIPFNFKFDLIFDRGALTCNTTKGIENCLVEVINRLKKGGKYIGIDLFSTKHSEFRKGEPAEDKFTKKNYLSGPFAHTGRVHFFNKSELINIFKKFEIIRFEHKIIKTSIPYEDYTFATWNIIVKKSN